MLWYLHLCADAGIVVVSYEDDAEGTMIETAEGGRFTKEHFIPRLQGAIQASALLSLTDFFLLISDFCLLNSELVCENPFK
jgi:hypothetical protein